MSRVIAIDGGSGVGKTTLARGLGEALDLPVLETGAMYRAATLAALRRGVDPADEDAVVAELDRSTISFDGDGRVHLDGEDVSEAVRSLEVTAAVSDVAAHPRVRERLVRQQRALVRGPMVVEGRDIGTVVFPDAVLKLFLVAAPAVRGARRAADPEAAGLDAVDLATTLAERDHLDSTRPVSPLEPAPDSHILDTSCTEPDDVLGRALELARSAGFTVVR